MYGFEQKHKSYLCKDENPSRLKYLHYFIKEKNTDVQQIPFKTLRNAAKIIQTIIRQLVCKCGDWDVFDYTQDIITNDIQLILFKMLEHETVI